MRVRIRAGVGVRVRPGVCVAVCGPSEVRCNRSLCSTVGQCVSRCPCSACLGQAQNGRDGDSRMVRTFRAVYVVILEWSEQTHSFM